MRTGDLVMWTYHGAPDPKKTGVIVSDYTACLSKDGSVLKNVYWFDAHCIRPIEQQFLEVISESR